MQVRRIALVVCLLVGMTTAAAARMPQRAHRAGRMDDGIIANILDLLGLDNKIGIPPG